MYLVAENYGSGRLHLFQAAVFIFQFFQPSHQGRIHAAIFGARSVKRGRANAPCSRHISGTGVPASACFKIARIWLSLNREVFM
jgi:hypothetical protein